MSGKSFLDTNMLVYCYSKNDPEKQQKATAMASLSQTYISTLVTQELCNVLAKKFKLGWADISKVLEEVGQNLLMHTNTFQTVATACLLADRYQFAFYDSLILAAALECGCDRLFSEDLQHGQIIENQLTILNPFLL